MNTVVVGKHFKVYKNKALGEGSFGTVYLGEDTINNKFVAVKTEKKNANHNLLRTESNIIKYVNTQKNNEPVISNYWFGTDNDLHYFVTDLLGPSLESLLDKCGGRFSLKTTLMIAEQIVSRIKFYHDRNIIHRDIKPENFLVDFNIPHMNIYIIDFGLAKKYRKSSTKEHIPFKTDKPHVGTLRYMSTYTHEHYEQSRRDDMISIGYMLLYFLNGRLPWQGIIEKDKKKKYARIHQLKKAYTIDELTSNLHTKTAADTFKKYFEYVYSLKFEDEINYNFIIKLFLTCMDKHMFKYDYKWDWSESNH